MARFIITSTPILEGMKIISYLGVVNTNIVIGTNFFSDFAASFTDVFGGNSGTYQRKMDAMYESAKKELVSKVKNLGGNAIVGFRVEFDEISGKGKSMFMLTATGTACIVSKQQDDKNEVINISNVDAYDLEREITKITILNGLSKSFYSLSDEKWNYILENPTLDIAKLLVDKMYYQYPDTGKQKIEALVSKLDFEDAVAIVYSNYIEPKQVTYQNEFGSDITREVSSDYLKLIKNCKLLEPLYIIRLIDTNLSMAIALMTCDKNIYTSEDLKNMRAVCEKLDALPDTGRKERGKTGVFSKEKDIWVCEKGHKNELNNEYCLSCFINIKGINRNDMDTIKSFKTKTMALSNLMKLSSL